MRRLLQPPSVTARRFLGWGSAAGAAATTVWMLFDRLSLARTRYFDADEMAYLSWTAHLSQGLTPYRDFLFYMFPGYLLFQLPLFAHGATADVFTAVRVQQWGVVVALAAVAAAVHWYLRRSWTAVAAALVVACLPIPADKMLEARPDTLAVVWSMLGVLMQMVWMDTGRSRWGFVSGFLYGLGIFTLTKSGTFVVVAAIVSLGWAWTTARGPVIRRAASVIRRIMPFAAGGAILPVSVLLWAVSIGELPHVWYLIMKFPFESAGMMAWYYIAPGQFFFPSDVYYGVWGEHIGYWFNQAVWYAGTAVGSFRLVTPFIPSGKKGVWKELLVPAILLFQVYSFVFMIPIRHAQYLIPIAVLVAICAADGVHIAWSSLSRTRVGVVGVAVGWALVLLVALRAYTTVNTPKRYWGNADTVRSAEHLWRTIPAGEPVLDLVGTTLSFPYPYYACCLPIGQFSPYLTWHLPDMLPAMGKVNYIYQGQLGRAAALPPEVSAYVAAQFVPVGNGELLVRKGVPVPAGL